MALFCKENHCGSCGKAFCCFSCRSKHENYVHQKSKPDFSRKVLAPIRNVMFRSNNSLPKIPELVALEVENRKMPYSKNEQRTFPICIHNSKSDLSHLENELISCVRRGKNSMKIKNANSESTVESVLIDEETTSQINELTKSEVSENFLNVSVNVETFHIFESSECINISEPPEAIKNSFHTATAGNTPPRTQERGKLEEPDSITKGESTTNEDSSVYCACFDNLSKSEINLKSYGGDSKMNDSYSAAGISENKENCENSEKSSIYFACSECFTKESLVARFPGFKADMGEFDGFENDPKVASTKIEMTIPFSPGPYYEDISELQSETINSTDTKYMTPNLKEFPEAINEELMDNISANNDIETTLSAQSNSLSILGDNNFMNAAEICEKPDRPRECMGTWIKVTTTQTSDEMNTNCLGDTFEVAEESKENHPPIPKPTQLTHKADISLYSVYPSSATIGDHSFWQSFSNSIQRAYNSTKEICSGLGRKNRSKRELDDIEDLQPEPKRAKVALLCRPPIRENPKIIFRQDGDMRRSVIVFDKGTQTDLFY